MVTDDAVEDEEVKSRGRRRRRIRKKGGWVKNLGVIGVLAAGVVAVVRGKVGKGWLEKRGWPRWV